MRCPGALILTGLFATDGGLFYGGGFHYFLVQLLGVVCVIAWVAVTMSIIFTIIKKTIGLRVSAEEEIVGLDIMEHALVSSYAGFDFGEPDLTLTEAESKALDSIKLHDAGTHKITNISIITGREKFEPLKMALEKVGIQGMSVTEIVGCGVQKGNRKLYRGSQVQTRLLPKIKMDIVVSEVPVQDVVDAARSVLYTGGTGDGKIFITDVENVVRVSTGEQGVAAIFKYTEH